MAFAIRLLFHPGDEPRLLRFFLVPTKYTLLRRSAQSGILLGSVWPAIISFFADLGRPSHPFD